MDVESASLSAVNRPGGTAHCSRCSGSDQQLFGIIGDLAKRARLNPELDPKDLRLLVAVPGGDEANIYEELVGSGLLVSVPAIGGRKRFKVEPLRLVYGFGMLLAGDLAERSSLTTNELEEFLTSWFEPQPDMDRKVDICASAIFHALFQDKKRVTALPEFEDALAHESPRFVVMSAGHV